MSACRHVGMQTFRPPDCQSWQPRKSCSGLAKVQPPRHKRRHRRVKFGIVSLCRFSLDRIGISPLRSPMTLEARLAAILGCTISLHCFLSSVPLIANTYHLPSPPFSLQILIIFPPFILTANTYHLPSPLFSLQTLIIVPTLHSLLDHHSVTSPRQTATLSSPSRSIPSTPKNFLIPRISTTSTVPITMEPTWRHF